MPRDIGVRHADVLAQSAPLLMIATGGHRRKTAASCGSADLRIRTGITPRWQHQPPGYPGREQVDEADWRERRAESRRSDPRTDSGT